MGVCGSGKSSVGRPLALALGVDHLDGDDLHPPANIDRMAAGKPLTDGDRRGWLQALAARLAQRLLDRRGHCMPAPMLQSQLAALEPPTTDESPIDINASTAHTANALRHTLTARIMTTTFTNPTLFTDTDGRARFREENIALGEGKPQAMLSALLPSGGLQLRHSPVGFRSAFHCTETPQWVFILGGQMEIGLQDGSSRVFKPGEHFFSDDRLPAGATFDPALHGHWSRQLGAEPLVTAFVRA